MQHPNLAPVLNNMAELARAANRRSEAEPLYLRAVMILEKAFGPDHPDLAVTMTNLAELYDEQGNMRRPSHYTDDRSPSSKGDSDRTIPRSRRP